VTNGLYSDSFFSSIREGSERSAAQIVPIVTDLLRPESVIDVGCGTGAFLNSFKSHGVRDVLGVDGEWAQPLLDTSEFRRADLSKPLGVDRRFDLVVSLEVAEHLPASSARTFVQSLAGLGPLVLFSAAIPHQGGTGHLNEQWPDYWAGLFSEHGFGLVDCFRAQLWDNREVEWWYAQNMFLYAAADRLEPLQRNRLELATASGLPLRLVHPSAYLYQVALRNEQGRRSNRLRLLPTRIVRSIARRIASASGGDKS
jgi:SAM-dependent methyltransferase